MADEIQVVNALQKNVNILREGFEDYGPLLEMIGDSRFVLLGEASHGTREFYRARQQITQKLIEDKGFDVLAVEADWPDAYRVNRYVRYMGQDSSSENALSDFKRFPTWMWRNADVVEFVGWLRVHNERLAENRRVGFYGLDLYSLRASTEAVIGYLSTVDPEAAKRARYRYSCFDHFGESPEAYGYSAGFELDANCEKEVAAVLSDLTQKSGEYLRRNGMAAEDEQFFAEQNARVAKNAEEYYRSMFQGRVSSWNLRDQHMFETLEALVEHQRKQGQEPKVVVWAHNSHIGDARATDVSEQGELNIGQLVREKYGNEAVLVGFATYEGTVSAASDWGAEVENKQVRPALPGSVEELLHRVEIPDFYLLMKNSDEAAMALEHSRPERAIGVIYRPETDRVSHYFNASVCNQFDAIIYFDKTQAVEPLELTAEWSEGEVPETYPSAV